MAKADILVVDDDPFIYRIISKMLADEGYECESALNGQEALERLGQRCFDMMLVDLSMPVMSGLELVTRVIASGHSPIILILTGHSDISQAVEVMKLGAYDLLLKPVSADHLLSVVGRALEHRRMRHGHDELRQFAQRWEGAFDASPGIVAILDADNKILHCNRAMSRYLGLGKQEIIGGDCHDLFPALAAVNLPGAPGADGMPPQSCGESEIHSVETRDDRFGRDIQITAAPLGHEDGLQWGTVLFIHDTTEHKRMQKQLLHSQKMESVGTLAAGVAHEINNPVGFIHSNLNSLKRYLKKITDFTSQCIPFMDVAPTLNASDLALEASRLKALGRSLKLDFLLQDIEALIDESREGTERIRKIVASLKGFARNDDSKMHEVNLNDRLDGVINLAWNELKYKAQVIREYGEIPTLCCYAADLDQVFINLLINAAQAIAEKGEIRVRTWEDKRKIFISISDTGAGIPEHVLPHIFEPFYTTKPVGTGTGLGLSISYDIVAKHGGEIQVDSKPGQGTTFNIQLPIPQNARADGTGPLVTGLASGQSAASC